MGCGIKPQFDKLKDRRLKFEKTVNTRCTNNNRTWSGRATKETHKK